MRRNLIPTAMFAPLAMVALAMGALVMTAAAQVDVSQLTAPSPPAQGGDKAEFKSYLVDTGTHIPLSLSNSVSTKNSVPGDRVYRHP